ncbi:MAG: uridine kinase [Eubacterium sp.]|nr:uridine kinase [Eubacterium sp.]
MIYEKEICNSILNISSENGIVIVGIDGLGGAGKSTISEKICCEIQNNNTHTILLHIDDFINVRKVRYNSAYPEWQCYYDLQWRYGYFAEIINQIKNKTNDSIEIELYDKDSDCYFTQSYDIKEKTVVIVEGIFLQRKDLNGIFDYMVYIDIPENIRMTRVLKRDTYIGNEQQIIDKYENRYFPAERKYYNEYHPERLADFVIGG